MIERVLNLLTRLETVLPPPKDAHHCLTRVQYGSDESGWEDRLALVVIHNGLWWTFFPTDKELEEENIENLVLSVSMLVRHLPPNAQSRSIN